MASFGYLKNTGVLLGNILIFVVVADRISVRAPERLWYLLSDAVCVLQRGYAQKCSVNHVLWLWEFISQGRIYSSDIPGGDTLHRGRLFSMKKKFRTV